MKIAATLAVVGALAVAGWYAADRLPHDGGSAAPRRDQVASIRLDGPSLPTATLRAGLHTRVGAPLRESDLDADRKVISEELVARGHLDAAVDEPRVTWGSSGAHVTFVVAPGSVYHVRNVTVDGARFDGIQSVPTLAAGEDVSPARVARGAELIDQWLAHHGAEDAVVTSQLGVDRQTHAVDVTYTIERRRLVRR